MRVVDRETFLRMPLGTLYAKYGGEPTTAECLDMGDLRIKDDMRGEADWFWASVAPFPDHSDFDGLVDADNRLRAGEDLPPDFESTVSDGLFDQEQLFAVFTPADVEALIERLRCAQREAQAIEARRAATAKTGAVHESAVGETDAPK